ncbi:MAG: pyridoxal phosphate-dependent aminotransferase [Candidatus Acidiferrum sp.]
MTPNPLSMALAERRAAGKPVLDLTVSNPTECGFTFNSDAILAALSNPLSLTYEPEPLGLLPARQAVCEYYAERGDSVSPDSVVLTTSTSEAYSFVFRLLCNAGDEVLVPQPSYPLFDFLADLADVRLVRYPLFYDHGWQTDFNALGQALSDRTRAVIVVNPNNPTGNFSKPQEMARLNEICAARDMAIIADEVFLDYAFADNVPHIATPHRERAPLHQSFATNAQALTFTLSGVSKICGLPQMKAAWLVAGGPATAKREALARLEVIADTYLSMNAPVQHALPALLYGRHSFQEQLRGRIRQNLDELDRQLAPDHGLSRLSVEGGWCAVMRWRRALGDNPRAEFASDLLNAEGVLVHPGHFYDLASGGHAVVSLIVSGEVFANGIRSTLRFALS